MSTSSVGMDEIRKPLVNAYMMQRRILLGCNLSILVAIVIWIVAISTDHWFIITGGDGIYIPENRRFFQSAHAGLWKMCRYGMVPSLPPNSNAARTIPMMAYANASTIAAAKTRLAQDELISSFKIGEIQRPVTHIDETFRRKMFYSWINGPQEEFNDYKKIYHDVVVTKVVRRKHDGKNNLNPENLASVNHTVGGLLTPLRLNNTDYNLIVPKVLRKALFQDWKTNRDVVYLLNTFAKDLDLPMEVIDHDGKLVTIFPPVPPRKGKTLNGFEYTKFTRCQYNEMFPTEQSINLDPTLKEEYLDYTRTQASFACITVLIMTMGFVFSAYTFMNPRYMFKRLAGGVHLISAATSMVVIQVLGASVEYLKEHVVVQFPQGADYKFGYGVYLAYLVFACNLFAGIMFMWYSRKQKGEKAATEELGMADEAINIGR